MSDMGLLRDARETARGSACPLDPWDVTHPLGYPMLLVIPDVGRRFAGARRRRAVRRQLPGAARGRDCWARPPTGAAPACWPSCSRSLYFPFIEYGALFLSEIHFIFWLALAFAALFAARRARRRGAALALAAAGGFTLSIAAALKSVALPAAFFFFVVDGVALWRPRARAAATASPSLAARGLRGPWLLRGAVVRARGGAAAGRADARLHARQPRRFCVTGNKVGSDFLLGHYGRIADVEWRTPRATTCSASAARARCFGTTTTTRGCRSR